MADDSAALYASLVKEAKSRGESIKKLRASLKALPAQLADARKQEDALEIEAVHMAAEAQISAIEDELLSVKLMVTDLRAIEQDKTFILAHIAVFKVLVKSISDIRNELTKQLAEAKTIEKDAKKADEAQQDTQDDALRDLAVIERRVSVFKNAAQRLKDSQELLEWAESSVRSHDAKSLTEAQSAAKGKSVSGWSSTLSSIEADVASLLKTFRAKGFDEKVMKDIESQAKEILQSSLDARKTIKDIDDILTQIAKFEIDDIDMTKAAKALGIEDRALRAEMEKILGGDFDGLEKKLDALGQKLTPKAKGRNMMADLRKAKVF